MTKISKKSLHPKEFGRYVDNLWSAFTLADSKEDIRLLFHDLFTHTEYKMFAKRLEIARRLLEGETYEAITAHLQVTARTINTVSNTLARQGQGFRKTHKSLEWLEADRLKKQRKRQKILESPLHRETKRKTFLGAVLRTGLHVADKRIIKKLKHKTAKKVLPV